MKKTPLEPDETLPLELKLRILQAELDQLEADYRMLRERRREIRSQIAAFEARLQQTRRRMILRRVK